MMIASYSSDLADDHGRWIRDALITWGDELGIHLKPGSSAANRFDIDGGEGELLAAGISGGLTGRGARIAIVNDPVKDMAAADSPTMRNRAWDWWTSVLQTRLEPEGAICLIQTRWHEDDLAGRILATERDAWRVIDLPALADSPDDPLGRALGEPLWPELFDTTHHAKTRKGKREMAARPMGSRRTRRRAGRLHQSASTGIRGEAGGSLRPPHGSWAPRSPRGAGNPAAEALVRRGTRLIHPDRGRMRNTVV